MNLNLVALRYVLLCLLVLASLHVSAQKKRQSPIDSLLGRLAAAKDDTNKTNLLLATGAAYAGTKQAGPAFFYFHRALQLAQKLNWPAGAIKYDDALADYYYPNGDYTKAIRYAKQAVAISFRTRNYALAYSPARTVIRALARQNKTPQAIRYLDTVAGQFSHAGWKHQQTDLYLLIAGYAEDELDYNTAINYIHKALALAGNDPGNYLSPDNLFAITTIYSFIHQTDKANALLVRAQATYRRTGNLAALAGDYMSLGDCAITDNNYPLAASNYGKAAQIAEKIKDNYVAGYSENGMGWSFFSMKQYDSAYLHTKRALPFSKNDSGLLVRPLSTLGSIYREAPPWIIKDAGLRPGRQYAESARLLTLSVNYGLAHNEYEFACENLHELSKTYEKMHDYADAYKTDQSFIAQTNRMDSLKNEKALLLNEAKASYTHLEDSLRYRQHLISAQLKQKKLQSYFFTGGLAALLLLSVFIWLNFNNQRKANNRLVETLAHLKAAQQQLIQSEKMASLGELTAGIAHEIQNPLNFVNNFSEVSAELVDELEEELDRGDVKEAKALSFDLKENLGKIHHHGQRADGIVKSMLEHSRVSSGQKEPVNMNKLADEYLRLAYHGLRAKDKDFNAALVTHFDEALPTVNVIPQDMGRVLLNLFNNAFFAVQQKQKTVGPGYRPKVTLSTSARNQQVELMVSDNGTGIPDAVKDKIMQPFFTTKPTGEGTGLGLSLSYDIVVKGHSGSITVNSTEGEGSEFIIQLPTV